MSPKNSAFSQVFDAVREKGDQPPFKDDPAAAGPPLAAVPDASAEAMVTEPVGERGDRPSGNWRTKSRPKRITLDLTYAEYDRLRSFRTLDVDQSAILRGCIALLSHRPELLSDVRMLGTMGRSHTPRSPPQ